MTESAERASRLELNPAQKAALDLSTNIILRAAAGSGKTTVLIHRFLSILENNAFRPEEVVAITFTEAAAQQMRDRIRQEIAARVEEEKGAEKWGRALRHLPRSQISTIHGFCHRLLRAYSSHRDLSPADRVLAPSTQQLLARRAVHECLQQLSRQRNPDLRILLRYLPQEGLEGFFQQMLGRRHDLSWRAPMDFEWLNDLFRTETAAVVISLPQWKQLEDALAAVPEGLLNQSDPFSRLCRRQHQLLATRTSLAPREFLDEIYSTLETRVFPTPEWMSQGHQVFVSLWRNLKALIDRERHIQPCSRGADQHFRQALQAAQAVQEEVSALYAEYKQGAGGLDFEDLLIEASRLVARKDVASAIRKQFRFFLVDELQDTNDLQWQILSPLVEGSTNLLLVGDSKQSVYRFRRADVSVFQRVHKKLGRRATTVEMPGNYRAAPALIAGCNHVFRNIFSGDQSYEAQHQEMEASRCDDQEGTIESVFFTGEVDRSAAHEEPDLVARTVKRLTGQGLRHGDIAILLRARTRLKFYEDTLRSHGIPFQSVGGTGFYRRQEVLDLLNLMRFLASPRDDIGLLGLLRSPLFGFSDEELLDLSRQPGESLWEKLRKACHTEKERFAEWQFAFATLDSCLRETEVSPASFLLERVLARTGFPAVLSVSRRGAQARQNVRKLVSLVRDFESEPPRHIRQVVRFLEDLTQAEPNEPEAEMFRPGEDAVRIFTIHGAKGLQFPAVILPELGRPLARLQRDRFVVERFPDGPTHRTYFGFKIWDPSHKFRDVRHPVYQMLRKLDTYRQMAEEKRLLYVAFTRAENHLVLIGERGEQNSYLGWLLDAGIEQAARPLPQEILQAEDKDIRRGEVETDTGFELPPREQPVGDRKNMPAKSVWSPTQITDFQRCGRRFLLGRELGYPESGLLRDARDPWLALRGEVVHDLIEKIEDIRRWEEVETHLERWGKKVEPILEGALSGFLSQVSEHLRIVSASPIYCQMVESHVCYREQQFHTCRGKRELTGVFDALYQKSDQSWVVVDFKTVEATPENRCRLRTSHRLQVELYLWAASQILRTRRIKGVLFFTANGEKAEVEYSREVRHRCLHLIDSLPLQVEPEAFPLTTRPSLCANCGFLTQDLCGGALKSVSDP